MQGIIISCPKCGKDLTKPLVLLTDLRIINTTKRGRDLFPQGFYATGETIRSAQKAEFSEYWESVICVNLKDLSALLPSGERCGCCGIDGLDGLNLSCPCKTAVGTECSDCWQEHHARFSKQDIKITIVDVAKPPSVSLAKTKTKYKEKK